MLLMFTEMKVHQAAIAELTKVDGSQAVVVEQMCICCSFPGIQCLRARSALPMQMDKSESLCRAMHTRDIVSGTRTRWHP